MNNSQEQAVIPREAAPTAKEKNAVHRAVSRLLDSLAPERAIKRSESPPARVEQYRTPGGCVLQADNAALSVSWYDDRRNLTLGELHINVWKGTVSRGGASYRRPEHAVVVKDLVLRPVGGEDNSSIWRADDGREFDTPRLQVHCLALLEAQIRQSAP